MRRLVFAVMVMLAVPAFVGGCGGVYYTVSANAAQSRLEQARQLGAETQAPYEYYFAREHLRQAQVEAAEASYSDAASYAETAELYAQKAIDAIEAAKKSSGEAK
jgi:Tfp pilus assembly protein FimT